MAKKQSGLGKGLGALMLENSVDEMVATNTLPLNEIMPNKEQPRRHLMKARFRNLLTALFNTVCFNRFLSGRLHRADTSL